MNEERDPMRGRVVCLRAGVLVGALVLSGCDFFREEPPELPTEESVRTLYAAYPDLSEVQVRGNVVRLTFLQSQRELRRGGSLWARAGVYVFLLSPATRELFTRYPGVAAARVVTVDAEGELVAQALLHRDALSDLLWRRTLNILGHALREGSRRPGRLEELVSWGEQHADYEYGRRYVPEEGG